MSLDDAFRFAVREELRVVVREEIRAALVEVRPRSGTEDGYLSVEQAAAFAAVHPDTIRAWVKAGRLPEHRAGRELRLLRDELHRFLERAGATGGKPTPQETAAKILAGGRK